MRGADHLAAAMAEAGVKVVFSLSGNQIMPLYDALIDPGIRIIHTRHEAAAVFMADAYAQLTGDIGIALVTAAPGFGNALGALYTAAMQEAPVVFMSGDSPVGLDGQLPFQEFPQVAAASPFVKHSRRIEKAEDCAAAFAEAARIARSGRPGPVHLALPFDVLNDDAGSTTALGPDAYAAARKDPAPDAVADIAGRLGAAERPLILTSTLLSPSRAGDLPGRLADAVDAPVILMESPRGLRDPMLGAFAEAMREADCVLYLGKPVDFTTGFGKPPQMPADTVMIVDPEPDTIAGARRQLGNRLAVAHEADAPAFAAALAEAGGGGEARAGWRASVADAVGHRPAPKSDGTRRAPAVAAAIQSALDKADDAVFIGDGGEFGQWMQALVSARCRVINGLSGAIGGCLPYAIAAKIARPDATVIAAMGDGTVGFHFAEFETAARENAACTIVVGNDMRWNAEYTIQVRDFGPDRTIGCELSADARYADAAAALGCHGEQVNGEADLEAGLDRAIASGRPACLDIAIGPLAAPAFSRGGGAPQGAH